MPQYFAYADQFTDVSRIMGVSLARSILLRCQDFTDIRSQWLTPVITGPVITFTQICVHRLFEQVSVSCLRIQLVYFAYDVDSTN